ncbi:MAG: InlB B-repeat-containing protein, partial [Clostridia bacterium]|nr:InlB B-repeat-containing protein [Clostridia bacterium]
GRALAATEKKNHIVDGWYREKDPYSGRWDGGTDIVSSDLTLYAKWREIGALPDEYVPVEYLEALAGQKLSPGLKTLENVDRIVTDIRFTNMKPGDALSSYQVPVGSGSNAGRHWGMAYDPAAKKYGYYLEGDIWLHVDDPGARAAVDFEMVGGAPEVQGCRLTVGEEEVWRSIAHKEADYVKGSEFSLMNVGSYAASVRLYSAQVYFGGVKTADYVPCRNVKTGEFGVYDRIGEKFFASASEKGFTGGPDCP